MNSHVPLGADPLFFSPLLFIYIQLIIIIVNRNYRMNHFSIIVFKDFFIVFKDLCKSYYLTDCDQFYCYNWCNRKILNSRPVLLISKCMHDMSFLSDHFCQAWAHSAKFFLWPGVSEQFVLWVPISPNHTVLRSFFEIFSYVCIVLPCLWS